MTDQMTVWLWNGATRVYEPRLDDISGLTFGSAYPGGYMDAQFVIPIKPAAQCAIKGNERVQIFDGHRIAWEGKVAQIERNADGLMVSCLGYWGDVLGARMTNKPWADDRV